MDSEKGGMNSRGKRPEMREGIDPVERRHLVGSRARGYSNTEDRQEQVLLKHIALSIRM